MQTVAVYNLKGGVGKTATAVNLAFLAAQEGRRTLLWDLDPQGAASFYLRVKARVKGGGKKLLRGDTDLDQVLRPTAYPGLELLPADFSYRSLDLVLDDAKKPAKQLARTLGPLAGRFDLAFLDCPPSVSLVSEAVLHAADLLLIPVIPTTLSMRTLRQIEDFVLQRGPRRLRLAPFFCQVDARKKLHRELAGAPRAQGEAFLATTIPYASVVERMGTERAPIAVFAPSSPAAQAYAELWREIANRLQNV
jgi:chromosome partitioning protein